MEFLNGRQDVSMQKRATEASEERRRIGVGHLGGLVRGGAAALALAVGGPGMPGGGMPLRGNGFAPLLESRASVQIVFSKEVAGYFALSSIRRPEPYFTGVEGSWAVGSGVVMKNKNYVAYTQAVSIGIKDAIYVGTSSFSADGRIRHFAIVWGARHAPVRVPGFIVREGDIIEAGIEKAGEGRYSITIRDITNGKSYSESVARKGEARMAGWILQRSSNEEPRAVPENMQDRAEFITATVNEKKKEIGSANLHLVGSMIIYDTGGEKGFPTLAATISYVKKNAKGFSISYTGN